MNVALASAGHVERALQNLTFSWDFGETQAAASFQVSPNGGLMSQVRVNAVKFYVGEGATVADATTAAIAMVPTTKEAIEVQVLESMVEVRSGDVACAVLVGAVGPLLSEGQSLPTDGWTGVRVDARAFDVRAAMNLASSTAGKFIPTSHWDETFTFAGDGGEVVCSLIARHPGGGGKKAWKSTLAASVLQTTDDWSAWINIMPTSGPPTLHVTGAVDMGSEFESADLVEIGWEKSNPPNLLLGIVPKTIFIPRKPGENSVAVHYQRPHTSQGNVGEIKIFRKPGGTPVKIIKSDEIEIVS